MKVQFAPLNIPVRRRVQTAAVLQWIFSFLALAQCCLAAFVLLCVSDWWILAALYAGWLYLDRDTPSSGGRRSHWVRSCTVWKYFRDYFPISLVKTVDLDPKRNYLFGFHPHGVLVAGAFGNFCTEASEFSKLFPGLTPYLLMLPFWFRVPFFRDYIMFAGLVSSEKTSMSYLLSHPRGGAAAVVAVGGAPESLEARPGALTLQLLQRKGFIKLALKHGGVFQYSFGLLPYRRPIHTVVGRPIAVDLNPCPTKEDIDCLHQRYMKGLTQLFEENKEKYGIDKDKHLKFI
ncbi:hypothetical protein AMELA_G00198400 [Ameiurus melas]|uniref:Acyltransferase n=1 Tax=Ameiurus melas TaxID=219545 RepID=A0A7J6A6A4_AMEME|nr:hypothetical protein AMELA_G00198400 [Ameiurus melas]